jgi:hypothetical protein
MMAMNKTVGFTAAASTKFILSETSLKGNCGLFG